MSEKDKSKAELIEEINLLRAQTEASLDGMAVMDGEGLVVLSNRRFREMWKLPQEIAESRDGEKICAYILTMMKDPEAFSSRMSYRRVHPEDAGWSEVELRDGRIFEEYLSPLGGEAGQCHGSVCYFRDITDRKRAEELFSTVFHANPVATAITALADNCVRQVNDALLHLLGYTRDEVVGRTINDLDVWPDAEQYASVVAKLRGGEDIHHLEGTVRCKSGELRQVLFSAVKSEIAGVPYLFLMAVDITERKRAEEAIVRAKEEWERTFDAVPDLIAILDKNHRIARVNRAMASRIGLSPGECVGRVCYKPVHGTEKPPDFCPHTKLIADGQEHAVDVFLERLGGHFVASVSPLHDAEGRLTGAVHVARDVTERKRLEEQLRQTQKMEAIGQLAGGVAHDFNNQLAGIMGYADMLANDLVDEEQKGYAEAIVRAATRSADLTQQLLAFARKGKNLAVPVNIHSVIAEVVMLLEHSIDKRVAIRQHLDANPPMTTGDPTQLQNAFLNLAINARDAMPDGGELTFQTDMVVLDEHYRENHPYAVAPGRYVRVCVTDTGMGMDEDTQKRIFEPFFTTKELGRGTGMGLAAVYGTIKNHLGSIAVYSEAGHGTTFKVYLPLAESVADEDEGAVSVRPVKGTARILVVDDEEVVRDMAATMLRELGYKVAVCKDGAEAVEYYRESWPHVDLVVLDMVMPKMGGRDTFVAMRKINPEIRALLSSGYSINGEAQGILDEGVLGFLQKPFQVVAFSEAVADALGR